MRVLVLSSLEDLRVVGGKAVQVEETRLALGKAGIEVSLAYQVPKDSSLDLVHIFRGEGCGYTLARCVEAAEAGLPIVLEPVWDDYRELFQYQDRILGRSPEAADTDPEVRAHLAAWEAAKAELSLCCALSHVVLSNSHAEANLVSEITGLAADAIHFVPNSVDPMFAQATPDDFSKQHGLRDFVLCAARIEDRKNQLSLIEAARDLPVDLVLIGEERQSWYSSMCRTAATSRVHFLPAMSRERLASAYAAAAVHALPSWHETTGLASLEAALAGCRIVSTDRGGPKEYLGENAWYCDPGDISAIRAALEGALAGYPSPLLKERILSEYSAEKTALALQEAYTRTLHAAARPQPPLSSLARLAESWRDLEAAQWKAAEFRRTHFREREEELIARARELEEAVRQRDEDIQWHVEKVEALQAMRVHLEKLQDLKIFRLYDRFSRSWLYRLYSFLARRKAQN